MNSFLYIASIAAIMNACSVVSINIKLYLHARKMHDSDLKSCLGGPVLMSLPLCLKDILHRQVYSCPRLKKTRVLYY